MASPEEQLPQKHAAAPNLSGLLDSLASPDPQLRERAAKTIYAIGLAWVQRATAPWFQDPEIRRHFSPESSALAKPTVGIAVRPERFSAVRSTNDSPKLADVPADIDAREFELHFPEGAVLDVLTTRSDSVTGDGAIARFLNRNGEGIQQVELSVPDVNRAVAALRDRLGLQPVYAEARAGADGTLVNFLLVDFATTEGENKKLLIELVESRRSR